MGDRKRMQALRLVRNLPLVASRGFHASAPAQAGPGMYAFSPVKTDQKVEKWAAHREDIEQTFFFTTKNNNRLLLFVGIVPVMLYSLLTSEMRTTDKTYNRDQNGSSNTRGFKRD